MQHNIIQPVGLEPGMYFGLPAELYHNDPAISRSDLVNLIDTPRTYWANSHLNPNRERKKKPNKEAEYGEAMHWLLFEPKEFKRRYAIIPYEEMCNTKKNLTSTEFEQMKAQVEVLRECEDSSLFLRGGYPEVTIIFDYAGLRFRTRHDYLMIPSTCDFKTTYTLNEYHIRKEFRERGLDIQMALYKLSRRVFKEQFRTGKAGVYGHVDPKWFQRFMEESLNDFTFVFQRTTEPYPAEPIWPSEDTEDTGLNRIERAVKVYIHNVQKYGYSKRWPASRGKLREFSMNYGFKD